MDLKLRNILILFFSWFEPFVLFWLEENDELSMEYLYGAIEKDKKDGVSITDETKCRRNSRFEIMNKYLL